MVFAVHRWPSGRRGLRSIGVVDRGDDGYVRVVPAWERGGGFTAAAERVHGLLAERGAP
ncbi:hypothetical protein [Tsukamurella paurometabola]|uniref:hypothetical protein n=1 Tax=Tsukamurella paurometabola TaxID=2061 RepID=UPI0018D5931A|nr:hypothetical protein [Tsukamurella paurometabola]UEA81858.1 hypothetical protein LK411_15910 [Tsukamurella paurometabola]